MMHKASGLIALLLVAAIILLPLRSPTNNGSTTETPLTVSGVSAIQSDSALQDDEVSDTTKIIAVVIIVVIVIFIIYGLSQTNSSQGAETNHAVRR